jgi:hypothetical protein
MLYVEYFQSEARLLERPLGLRIQLPQENNEIDVGKPQNYQLLMCAVISMYEGKQTMLTFKK